MLMFLLYLSGALGCFWNAVAAAKRFAKIADSSPWIGVDEHREWAGDVLTVAVLWFIGAGLSMFAAVGQFPS